jgi:hypothetical protein
LDKDGVFAGKWLSLGHFWQDTCIACAGQIIFDNTMVYSDSIDEKGLIALAMQVINPK